MIALALLTALVAQDTNTALSPRVRAMLDRFPPPHNGEPSITTAFSHDTVWVGEQVELVTATWFPRRLRDQLRRQPTIRAPAMSGLWSARNQMLPIPAGSRFAGNQVYDLYVTYQTIFPLGPGRIDAPAALLIYDVPTSTSYFAPEVNKSVLSQAIHLMVRAIPATLTSALGTGPTATNLRIAWRGPAEGLRVGLPAIVELVISGAGNLTLWPAPEIAWPPGIHVYPEPTAENVASVQGIVAGEKRFRYTVVADSAGVLTLPAVTYPYFDPVAGTVHPATAGMFTLPILPRPTEMAERKPPPVTGLSTVPWATRVLRSWWAALVCLLLLPPWLAIWRTRRAAPRAIRPPASDPEAALRAALGAPVEAGPDHVVAALRLRGIPRDDAEHVHRWLTAMGRRRYGPNMTEGITPPPAVNRVLARLRCPAAVLMLLLAALPLRAKQDDGVSRYQGEDYVGAARAFAATAQRQPDAPGPWRDLGAARWMQGDDIGAAAAWLRALRLAPRDQVLRAEWRDLAGMPPDIRALVPTVPLSLDELMLIAAALWLATWVAALTRRHGIAWSSGALLAAVAGLALLRWHNQRPGEALVTTTTALRISPHTGMMPLGDVSGWSLVQVARHDQSWVLVRARVSASSGLLVTSSAGWVPAASIAAIGPLD